MLKRVLSFLLLVSGQAYAAEPVDLVWPWLDSANSRWFFFNSATRPFGMVNLSPDTENEYLADGLAAELMSLLTTIPDLKVAARTSAFAFKGQNIDVTEIAEKLRVAYVLSGSVRQSGNTLRISAQLSDGSDGFQVWSKNSMSAP